MAFGLKAFPKLDAFRISMIQNALTTSVIK